MTKEQWTAISNNDSSFDGKFFYALKTTGTVCRPSCTARNCNPKNVIIFESLDQALDAGFRPCQRCHPDMTDWEGAKKELTDKACEYIEKHYTEKFSLDTLAAELFVNKSYLLRAFKENTGKTLLEYHNYIRCNAARKLLTRPELSISFISSSVGYCTSSHFTRVFKKIFGYTPSEYKSNYLDTFTK